MSWNTSNQNTQLEILCLLCCAHTAGTGWGNTLETVLNDINPVFPCTFEKWKSLSRVQLCDPMDCIVQWILQARILEWVAFPFSRGSCQPRDGTQVSCIARRTLYQLSHQGRLEWPLSAAPKSRHICLMPWLFHPHDYFTASLFSSNLKPSHSVHTPYFMEEIIWIRKEPQHWLLPLNLVPSSWENCPCLLLSQTSPSIWPHALTHSAHHPMIYPSVCTSARAISCIILNIHLRYYMAS